jgi:NADPH:quinone reductase-like Zn-dependent oxidoreductase
MFYAITESRSSRGVFDTTLCNPTAIKLTTLSLKGLATTIDVSKKFLWSVPDNWSLDGAATVPVVYTTAFYALVVRGRIKRGDRVLIHSGSGGVGQAAISIALHHGYHDVHN